MPQTRPTHPATHLGVDSAAAGFLPAGDGHATDSPDIVSSSDEYALRFAGPGGRYLLGEQARAVGRLLQMAVGKQPTTAPSAALDVAGGHLQIAPILAAHGFSVVVQGSTPAFQSRVEPLAECYPPGRVETRVGPLRRLPAEDREFDLVANIRTLGHVTWWREFLAELCRVTRRHLLVEFAARVGFQRAADGLYGLKHMLEGDTRRFFTYDTADVAAELRVQGFRVVALEREFVLPIVLHRVAHRPTLSGRIEEVLRRLGLTTRFGTPVLLLAERVADAAAAGSYFP